MTITVTPTMTAVLKRAIESYIDDTFTSLICKVESYDVTTQTADLSPIVKRPMEMADGTLTDLEFPVFPEVPVLFPRAGDWFMSMPVTAGDTMLVVFSSRDFQEWRETGLVSTPTEIKPHPFSAALAIPLNIYARSEALSNASDTNMVIGNDSGVRMYLRGDGKIHLGEASDFVALSTLTNTRISNLETAFNALVTVFNAHVHSGVTAGAATSGTTTAPGTPAVPGSSVAATVTKAE